MNTAASKIEQLIAKMKALGFRETKKRRMLLEVMAAAERPLSINEIHALVGKSRCDLVTLYRCLDAFEDGGLVRRYFRLNGGSLFALEFDEPEFYAMSRFSALITPAKGNSVVALRRALKSVEEDLRSAGYTGVSHTVQFFVTSHPNEKPVPSPWSRYHAPRARR